MNVICQCDRCEKEFNARPENFDIYEVQDYRDGVEEGEPKEEAYCFCYQCAPELIGDDEWEEWKS